MGQQSNQLRIIGGQWRGRKLMFPSVEGLRPTPDRVRETVFNWLMPVINGARCLDLFAGSGAMGLEALSRGAREVIMVDSNPQVIRQLRSHVELLGSKQAKFIQTNAVEYLKSEASAFDIVFLDPPYAAELLPECIHLLSQSAWLGNKSYIYMETAKHQSLPELPSNWQLHRSKTAGQVAYHLAIFEQG